MTEQGNYKIKIFNKEHAHKIALFQIITAKDLENLDMSLELVTKAVQYLQFHQQFGFVLVKLRDQITIGSLLLTFQNSHTWWIQSVYVQKEYRRQGHFKDLFYETCKIAKQRWIRSLKLYALDENTRAISAYKTLGMQMTDKKFYSFDFVYGKIRIEEIRQKKQNAGFQVRSLKEQKCQISQEFQDLLQMKSESENEASGVYFGQKIIAKAFYFTEFSQWRFGLTYYIDSLWIHKEIGSQQIQKIHIQLCCYFENLKQLKMRALRYIVNSESYEFPTIVKNGQMEHYVVMEMNF